ncbi:MAG TPA: hypothetical protein VE398_02195 [Acidobacteriota bacterium]|nr:hypothetical protein [Acidobacteriota bacterium]
MRHGNAGIIHNSKPAPWKCAQPHRYTQVSAADSGADPNVLDPVGRGFSRLQPDT